jgi:hypothetical protein
MSKDRPGVRVRGRGIVPQRVRRKRLNKKLAKRSWFKAFRPRDDRSSWIVLMEPMSPDHVCEVAEAR